MNRFPGGTVLSTQDSDLHRIQHAFDSVAFLLGRLEMKQVKVTWRGDNPTTSVDRKINEILRSVLPSPGEGWLSEDSVDDLERLKEHRVWIVDPIDGTREFLLGNGEWCISIALVEDGHAVAGGVMNFSTEEIFLGDREVGLIECGAPRSNCIPPPDGVARVLVSRKEHSDGKCRHLDNSALAIVPIGSVAYRLAQVAAGRAEATCTFGPRHEWDVAAGVALIRASGGTVRTFNGEDIRFNRPRPRVDRLLALSRNCDLKLPHLLIGGMA